MVSAEMFELIMGINSLQGTLKAEQLGGSAMQHLKMGGKIKRPSPELTVTLDDVKREPCISESPAAFISFKYVVRKLYLNVESSLAFGVADEVFNDSWYQQRCLN